MRGYRGVLRVLKGNGECVCRGDTEEGVLRRGTEELQ